jgi:galactose mutarotase-like enzyme
VEEGADRNETDKERLDRNLNELLGELRVALPGVQVLFAFLLAVPFNQRFAQTTSFEKGVYFVTLLSTAVAAALLIAPSSMHRIEFRADDKRFVVFTANRLAIAGFAALGVAMTAAVLLVTHFLYSNALAIVTTAIAGLLIFGLWYVMPLARLREIR